MNYAKEWTFQGHFFFWNFFPQNVSPHYANEGLMKRKWNWLILEGGRTGAPETDESSK